MLNSVYQKKTRQKSNAKEISKHDLNQVYQHKESHEHKKKKKEKVEYVTVPKLFKTPEFQNGMFFSNLLGLSFSCTVKQMVKSVF